jgi:hypothetical protein
MATSRNKNSDNTFFYCILGFAIISLGVNIYQMNYSASQDKVINKLGISKANLEDLLTRYGSVPNDYTTLGVGTKYTCDGKSSYTNFVGGKYVSCVFSIPNTRISSAYALKIGDIGLCPKSVTGVDGVITLLQLTNPKPLKGKVNDNIFFCEPVKS